MEDDAVAASGKHDILGDSHLRNELSFRSEGPEAIIWMNGCSSRSLCGLGTAEVFDPGS